MHAHIDGVVQMKSFVPGEPEMRVGFNDDLVFGGKGHRAVYGQPQMDHYLLHECVMAAEFEGTKTLSFIPPEVSLAAARF